MATYHEFDEKAIASALEAASSFNEEKALDEKSMDINVTNDAELSLSGGCISATVSGGRICLRLPLGLGQICIPIPNIFPDGTVAQVCLRICFRPLPRGVKVTVSIGGQVVAEQTFGRC